MAAEAVAPAAMRAVSCMPWTNASRATVMTGSAVHLAATNLRRRLLEAAGRLLLARDRIGIKPLYYRWIDGQLSFGSEAKRRQFEKVRPAVRDC